jgi:hypothetical protein
LKEEAFLDAAIQCWLGMDLMLLAAYKQAALFEKSAQKLLQI